MARSPKLKVFRIPVGFHDAYVAAPSQKAAAEAWGADPDVFRRGEAEQVTDPALTAEPLASPGTIVKRLRGTEAEQLAALGDTPSASPRKPGSSSTKSDRIRSKSAASKKPKPRPSRAALDQAEAALAAAEAEHGKALHALAAREADLAREREKLEQAQQKDRTRLEAQRDKAEAAYEKASQIWRES